ncbi:hypothetical protein PAHAL_8G240700 [Panicum hallii]|uniref:Uncharacterized protein n=1 Tax=Panicum hallii TaxID=206008 RepID=A0A2T8IA36_9POAL|nr:hypothetical protein PAHAL_8G240700 [Panicum hallii]
MIVEERLDLCWLDKVVLLETPKGFVLFNIKSKILNAPKNVWSWFAHRETAEHVGISESTMHAFVSCMFIWFSSIVLVAPRID